MDYYTELKLGADFEVSALFKSVLELRQQLPKIIQRRNDERNNIERLTERIEKLKRLSGESLTGELNSYEKFKTSLKKLNTELDAAQEAERLLSGDIIPKKQRQQETAEANLKIKLNVFLLRSRVIPDAKINQLLQDCIKERQDFLDAFTRIYSDYGLGFIVSDESYCPGIWRADEIQDLKLRLGMFDATDTPIPVHTDSATASPANELDSGGVLVSPETLPLESPSDVYENEDIAIDESYYDEQI
jgi:hypothetical protein